MIKSWAAEIGNSGNGLVASKGSATLIRHGLRWKTHDMAEAEEFTIPVPDDDTYRNMPEEATSAAVLGGRGERARALTIGSSASPVKRNQQPMDASAETVSNCGSNVSFLPNRYPDFIAAVRRTASRGFSKILRLSA